eukprot:2331437-Amphidinium_carterae.1
MMSLSAIRNGFSGALPEGALQAMTWMFHFETAENTFTGALPGGVEAMTLLNRIYTHRNRQPWLWGPIIVPLPPPQSSKVTKPILIDSVQQKLISAFFLLMSFVLFLFGLGTFSVAILAQGYPEQTLEPPVWAG